MTTTIEIINQKHKVLEGKLSDYNSKVREGASQKVLAEAKTDLDNALDAYNDEKYIAFREECKKASNPVMEALIKLTYDGEMLRKVSPDEPISEQKLVPTKRNIDLVRFCDELEIKRDWKHDAVQFYKCIAVRAALEMGHSEKEAAHVYGNIDIDKEVAEVLKSKDNPNVKNIASNGSLKALLQRSLNEVLGFAPEAETPYIITKEHISSILLSSCRLTKPSDKKYMGKPTLKFLTQKQMMENIMSSFNLAITKSNFAFAYKAKKSAQTSEVSTSETVVKPETEKVSTPKKVSTSKKKASAEATTETTETTEAA